MLASLSTFLDHCYSVPPPPPQDTMQTALSHVGFIVKDRWPGVRGTLMWGLGPSGRINLTTLLNRPLLCASVTWWDFICTNLSACAWGLLQFSLAPGHLGWEEARWPCTSCEESLKSNPTEQ